MIPVAHAAEFVPLLKETTRILPEGGGGDIGVFVNNVFVFAISIAAAAAVVIFVIGGLRYLTSASGVSTEGAKTKMQNAVIGLIMLLATWIVFNTINPDILKLKIDPRPVTPITEGTMKSGKTSGDGSTESTVGGVE